MTWDSPVKYWLDIDELTSEMATFRHYGHDKEPSGVSITIPRLSWEDMGRPGRITAELWRADA